MFFSKKSEINEKIINRKDLKYDNKVLYSSVKDKRCIIFDDMKCFSGCINLNQITLLLEIEKIHNNELPEIDDDIKNFFIKKIGEKYLVEDIFKMKNQLEDPVISFERISINNKDYEIKNQYKHIIKKNESYFFVIELTGSIFDKDYWIKTPDEMLFLLNKNYRIINAKISINYYYENPYELNKIFKNNPNVLEYDEIREYKHYIRKISGKTFYDECINLPYNVKDVVLCLPYEISQVLKRYKINYEFYDTLDILNYNFKNKHITYLDIKKDICVKRINQNDRKYPIQIDFGEIPKDMTITIKYKQKKYEWF